MSDEPIPFTLGDDLAERIRVQAAQARAAELEELRHRVALLDGFVPCDDVYLTPDHYSQGDPYQSWVGFEELPDYPADLNACAEVEGRLVALGRGSEYVRALVELVGAEGAVLASAEERCRVLAAMPKRGRGRAPG